VTEHQHSSAETEESPADTQGPADTKESPAESATSDALESVTDTEQVVVPTDADAAETPAPSATAPHAEAAGDVEAAPDAEARADAAPDGDGAADGEAAPGSEGAADDAEGTDAEAVGDVEAAPDAEARADAAPDAGGATDGVAEAEGTAEGDAAASAREDNMAPGQTDMAVEPEVVIDDDTMRRALEAILMVTDEPLPVLTLARAVGRPTGDVAAALATLSDEYTEQGRGFDLRAVAGGWRYYTREEAAPYVERFVLDGQQARLTQAALETLAVVAYKQPVSRARVSAVRGVNVDGVMRTLISRGLVEEAGADTESQATLYRTTSYFLERMGMQSLDDLPELAPYLPEMDDMEEELAAQSAPPADPEAGTDPSTDLKASAAQAGVGAEANREPEVGGGSDGVDGELAAAEELEAGGGPEPEVGGPDAEDGELEPAEELEAGGGPEPEVGGPELAQDVDLAEIPELTEAPEAAAVDEPSADDIPDAEQSEFEAGRAEEPEADYESEEHGPENDDRLEPAEDLEATAGEIESDEETLPEPGTEEPGPAAQASYGVDADATGRRPNEGGGTRDAGTSGDSWSNRDDD
jgi:segregation and condensation protein B